MKAESAAQTIEDLKNTAADAVEFARDITVKAGRKLDAAYESTRRGLRQVKNSAEDTIEDARHGIKEHPLTVVTITALGGFSLGMLAGWLTGRRR